jgi:hypothetical protein
MLKAMIDKERVNQGYEVYDDEDDDLLFYKVTKDILEKHRAAFKTLAVDTLD